MMQEIINSYLSQAKNVTIKGLGAFKIVEHKPEYQGIYKTFTAPSQIILFEENNNETTGDFLNYLQYKKNISQLQAENNIADEIDYLKNAVEKNGFEEWPNFGNFKKDEKGSLIFIPKNAPNYFQKIETETVIRKNELHQIRVGESEKTNIEMKAFYDKMPTPKKYNTWWHYALYTTILILAYLTYYFIKNKGF